MKYKSRTEQMGKVIPPNVPRPGKQTVVNRLPFVVDNPDLPTLTTETTDRKIDIRLPRKFENKKWGEKKKSGGIWPPI